MYLHLFVFIFSHQDRQQFEYGPCIVFQYYTLHQAPLSTFPNPLQP